MGAFHGRYIPGDIRADGAQAHARIRDDRGDDGRVAVKNHKHGVEEQIRAVPERDNLETVLDSKMVADPLKVFDCSPITDGAAA